jgi:hypothetical protein
MADAPGGDSRLLSREEALHLFKAQSTIALTKVQTSQASLLGNAAFVAAYGAALERSFPSVEAAADAGIDAVGLMSLFQQEFVKAVLAAHASVVPSAQAPPEPVKGAPHGRAIDV